MGPKSFEKALRVRISLWRNFYYLSQSLFGPSCHLALESKSMDTSSHSVFFQFPINTYYETHSLFQNNPYRAESAKNEHD